MSETAHTPGPWVACDPELWRDDPVVVYTDPGDDGNTVEVCEVYSDPASLAERDANIRLIAAAPDLLAACEDLLRRFGFTDWQSVHDAAVIESARAAVAKAKGDA